MGVAGPVGSEDVSSAWLSPSSCLQRPQRQQLYISLKSQHALIDCVSHGLSSNSRNDSIDERRLLSSSTTWGCLPATMIHDIRALPKEKKNMQCFIPLTCRIDYYSFATRLSGCSQCLPEAAGGLQ